MLGLEMPLVIFESGQRIVDLLGSMANLCPDRDIVVFRELTKVHETAYRGRAAQVAAELSAGSVKGEFVLVVGQGSEPAPGDIDAMILEELSAGERPSEIARSIARSSGLSRSDVYARVLELAQRPAPLE
jgi:16S rRNA (cytidine1402-2'-O)-methyltransferase